METRGSRRTTRSVAGSANVWLANDNSMLNSQDNNSRLSYMYLPDQGKSADQLACLEIRNQETGLRFDNMELAENGQYSHRTCVTRQTSVELKSKAEASDLKSAIKASSLSLRMQRPKRSKFYAKQASLMETLGNGKFEVPMSTIIKSIDDSLLDQNYSTCNSYNKFSCISDCVSSTAILKKKLLKTSSANSEILNRSTSNVSNGLDDRRQYRTSSSNNRSMCQQEPVVSILQCPSSKFKLANSSNRGSSQDLMLKQNRVRQFGQLLRCDKDTSQAEFKIVFNNNCGQEPLCFVLEREDQSSSESGAADGACLGQPRLPNCRTSCCDELDNDLYPASCMLAGHVDSCSLTSSSCCCCCCCYCYESIANPDWCFHPVSQGKRNRPVKSKQLECRREVKCAPLNCRTSFYESSTCSGRCRKCTPDFAPNIMQSQQWHQDNFYASCYNQDEKVSNADFCSSSDRAESRRSRKQQSYGRQDDRTSRQDGADYGDKHVSDKASIPLKAAASADALRYQTQWAQVPQQQWLRPEGYSRQHTIATSKSLNIVDRARDDRRASGTGLEFGKLKPFSRRVGEPIQQAHTCADKDGRRNNLGYRESRRYMYIVDHTCTRQVGSDGAINAWPGVWPGKVSAKERSGELAAKFSASSHASARGLPGDEEGKSAIKDGFGKTSITVGNYKVSEESLRDALSSQSDDNSRTEEKTKAQKSRPVNNEGSVGAEDRAEEIVQLQQTGEEANYADQHIKSIGKPGPTAHSKTVSESGAKDPQPPYDITEKYAEASSGPNGQTRTQGSWLAWLPVQGPSSDQSTEQKSPEQSTPLQGIQQPADHQTYEEPAPKEPERRESLHKTQQNAESKHDYQPTGQASEQGTRLQDVQKPFEGQELRQPTPDRRNSTDKVFQSAPSSQRAQEAPEQTTDRQNIHQRMTNQIGYENLSEIPEASSPCGIQQTMENLPDYQVSQKAPARKQSLHEDQKPVESSTNFRISPRRQESSETAIHLPTYSLSTYQPSSEIPEKRSNSFVGSQRRDVHVSYRRLSETLKPNHSKQDIEKRVESQPSQLLQSTMQFKKPLQEPMEVKPSYPALSTAQSQKVIWQQDKSHLDNPLSSTASEKLPNNQDAQKATSPSHRCSSTAKLERRPSYQGGAPQPSEGQPSYTASSGKKSSLEAGQQPHTGESTLPHSPSRPDESVSEPQSNVQVQHRKSFRGSAVEAQEFIPKIVSIKHAKKPLSGSGAGYQSSLLTPALPALPAKNVPDSKTAKQLSAVDRGPEQSKLSKKNHRTDLWPQKKDQRSQRESSQNVITSTEESTGSDEMIAEAESVPGFSSESMSELSQTVDKNLKTNVPDSKTAKRLSTAVREPEQSKSSKIEHGTDLRPGNRGERVQAESSQHIATHSQKTTSSNEMVTESNSIPSFSPKSECEFSHCSDEDSKISPENVADAETIKRVGRVDSKGLLSMFSRSQRAADPPSKNSKDQLDRTKWSQNIAPFSQETTSTSTMVTESNSVPSFSPESEFSHISDYDLKTSPQTEPNAKTANRLEAVSTEHVPSKYDKEEQRTDPQVEESGKHDQADISQHIAAPLQETTSRGEMITEDESVPVLSPKSGNEFSHSPDEYSKQQIKMNAKTAKRQGTVGSRVSSSIYSKSDRETDQPAEGAGSKCDCFPAISEKSAGCEKALKRESRKYGSEILQSSVEDSKTSPSDELPEVSTSGEVFDDGRNLPGLSPKPGSGVLHLLCEDCNTFPSDFESSGAATCNGEVIIEAENEPSFSPKLWSESSPQDSSKTSESESEPCDAFKCSAEVIAVARNIIIIYPESWSEGSQSSEDDLKTSPRNKIRAKTSKSRVALLSIHIEKDRRLRRTETSLYQTKANGVRPVAQNGDRIHSAPQDCTEKTRSADSSRMPQKARKTKSGLTADKCCQVLLMPSKWKRVQSGVSRRELVEPGGVDQTATADPACRPSSSDSQPVLHIVTDTSSGTCLSTGPREPKRSTVSESTKPRRFINYDRWSQNVTAASENQTSVQAMSQIPSLRQRQLLRPDLYRQDDHYWPGSSNLYTKRPELRIAVQLLFDDDASRSGSSERCLQLESFPPNTYKAERCHANVSEAATMNFRCIHSRRPCSHSVWHAVSTAVDYSSSCSDSCSDDEENVSTATQRTQRKV